MRDFWWRGVAVQSVFRTLVKTTLLCVLCGAVTVLHQHRLLPFPAAMAIIFVCSVVVIYWTAQVFSRSPDMPRYIIKLDDHYLEWSTIVDAPVTYGMTLEQFKHYYKDEYGAEGMRRLGERLQRVDDHGCSAFGETLDALLAFNRAGVGETCLTKEQIIDHFVHRRGNQPVGTREEEKL